MEVFEYLSLAIAVIAAGVAWFQTGLAREHALKAGEAAAEANRIQEQLLDLERGRDAKAEAALNQASVTATYEKSGPNYRYVIRNSGPGVAKNVKLVLTNMQLAERGSGQSLHPGEVRDFEIRSGMVAPKGYVEWVHPSGERGTEELRFKP